MDNEISINQTPYTTDFLNSLGIMKIGSILFFLIVTAVYQYKFHNIKQANTLLASKKMKGHVMIDSIITGLLGVISIMIVFYIREKQFNLMKYSKAYFYVFIILFLFTFSQESSGFNRYRAKKETTEGKGPYAEIDGTTVNGILNQDGINKFKESEIPSDYFMTSTAYTCFIIMICISFYFVIRMFICSFKGINNHPISKAYGIDNSNAILKFTLELFILVIINGVAPFISAKLRGEKVLSKSSLEMTGIIVIVSIVLHFMFQYTGVYNLEHTGWKIIDFVILLICVIAYIAYMTWSYKKH